MKEPVFVTIIHNMALGQFLCLKEKTHIRVRDATVAIGIPDAFGLLRQGEIFCRV